MRITRDGADWGEMQIEQDESGVQFHAAGALPQYGEILRVWGMRDGAQPLLIGVAEPDGDGLSVNRSMSRQYLASLGYWPDLPQRYHAGVRPPEASESDPAPGDPLIERAMRTEHVTVQRQGDADVLSCAFARDQMFPLAFAFCCCTVRGGRAQLVWDKEKGCPRRTAPDDT